MIISSLTHLYYYLIHSILENKKVCENKVKNIDDILLNEIRTFEKNDPQVDKRREHNKKRLRIS